MKPSTTPYILLADDDKDDCLLFTDALAELLIFTKLTTVHNGEHLMQMLHKNEQLPGVLFLDLNMPRKNGFACLSEIKRNEKLKDIPVIILSTSFEQDVVNLFYNMGAQHYFRKPNDFSQLKNLISQAMQLVGQTNFVQPTKDNFVFPH